MVNEVKFTLTNLVKIRVNKNKVVFFSKNEIFQNYFGLL